MNLITASPTTTLKEAEERLQGIEGLPVVDDSGKVSAPAAAPSCFTATAHDRAPLTCSW